MAAKKFAPLKAFVLRRSPMRLAMHGNLRDRIIEHVVEDWPIGCPQDRLEEVIRARMSVRLRERYGSVIAMFILSALANVVIRLILDWWFSSPQNRTLMAEWTKG